MNECMTEVGFQYKKNIFQGTYKKLPEAISRVRPGSIIVAPDDILNKTYEVSSNFDVFMRF